MSSPVKKKIPVATATPVSNAGLTHHQTPPPPIPRTITTFSEADVEVERESDTGIFRAFFCVYQAFSLNFRCRGTQEVLCFRKTACFECGNGAQSRGVGVLTNLHSEEYCRVACHCCDYALVKPKVCCAGASHVCCVRQAGTFPHHPEYLDEVVCAEYCISCLPELEVAAQPPKCPALDYMDMEFGVPTEAAASYVMDRGDGPVVVHGDYIKVSQEDAEEEDSEIV